MSEFDRESYNNDTFSGTSDTGSSYDSYGSTPDSNNYDSYGSTPDTGSNYDSYGSTPDTGSSYGRYTAGEDRVSYSGSSGGSGNYTRKPQRKKKKGGAVGKLLKLVASALLFGLIAGGTMVGVNMASERFLPSNTDQVQTTDSTEEDTSVEDAASQDSETDKETVNTIASNAVTTTDVSDVVQQVMPSVVSITCTITSNNYFYGTTQSQGAGSGFIISKNKQNLFIATNNHVVDDSTALTVGFADGTTADAQIVGTDPDADLAVISVKAEDISQKTASVIKVAVLGNSDSLKVGQPVIAIGNALGYGQSVTTGVLSAKDREVSFTDGTMVLLQTDAAINPGNSGGVLINQRGEVIGINNAKLEDTSVEGMGYAIPITTAKTILNDLMNSTTITEAEASFLGVVGRTINNTYSQTLGMPTGIYVTQVVTGSPAEKAGISAGDIITAFDGTSVSTMDGLKNKLSRKTAGTKVTVTLKRANQNGEYEEKNIEVTLGKKSDFANAKIDQGNAENQDPNNGFNGGNNGGNNGGRNDGDYYFTNPYDFFFGN